MQYKTSDIVLAAYLSLIGAELKEIQKASSTKGVFVFHNVVEQIIDDFLLGKAKVEPISFNNELRRLVTAVKAKGK